MKSCVVSQERICDHGCMSLTSVCTGCEGVGVKYIRSVQTQKHNVCSSAW